MESQVWKLVQKRTYDLLSHRYGLLMILAGGILITVSAFHFGEALLEWSHEKYATVFNSYSDNLFGRSYRQRLCLPVPIDVVYTWVNGSDPQLILQLHKVKMNMEEQLNITRPGQCTYSNCVPSPIVVLDGFPFSDYNVQAVRAAFSLNETHGYNYTALTASGQTNSLALELPSWEQAKALNGQRYVRGELNYTLQQAFYTSDSTLPHVTEMKEKVLMTGFPHEYSSARVLTALPEEHQKNVRKVEIHADKGVAVLHMTGSKAAENLLQLKNFTIEGKNPAFIVAFMVSDLTDLSRDGDVSTNRFEDNEELRYSLRSLERFAPWVRHVYIVTNGQIPYWLNLDNPRITVVTHQELFPNKSHLPTFSSPAIESHLHRIPGLSDKFLYFNDDVMFGSEVWPDDFFSFSTGQKLYLTWPVPSCNEGCPSNWIRDGYCDKACNSSECDWDGGDCSGSNGQVQLGAGFQPVHGQQVENSENYCFAGCANTWLADKYCDQTCNHLPCGFDAGDCGVSKFDQMVGFPLRPESDLDQHYTVPEGETLTFFNLTQVLGENGKITSANYKSSAVIRVAAISNKYNVLTLILHSDHNASRLSFHLKGHREPGQNFELNFTVSVNTSTEAISRKRAQEKMLINDTKDVEEEEIVLFEEYPKNILMPQALGTAVLNDKGPVVQFPFNISSNLTALGLSSGLLQSLSKVMADKADGDFTEGGFRMALADIHKQFLPEIKTWLPKIKADAARKTGDDTRVHAANGKEEQLRLHPDIVGNGKLRKLLESHDLDQEMDSEEKKIPGLVQMTVLDREQGRAAGGGDKETMTDEEFLDFVKARGKEHGPQETGGLPWEVQGVFNELQKRQKKLQQAEIYETNNRKGRVLNSFSDSLRHVNRLYNRLFGFASRKVPAHMPHLIDKHIMAELQALFPAEWEVTSANKVRSPDDMQFAFSYYYYMLGAMSIVQEADVFEDMDTDHSGILSDREIRTLATRLNDLPLYLETLTGIEDTLVNCSKNLSPDMEQKYNQQVLALPNEQYYEQQMPQVTKLLFVNCPAIVKQVKDKVKAEPKYRTTIMDDSSVAFKMIHGNVSKVVGQLDDIRKNPKKFICLNDDIDHGTEQAKTVKAVLQDFYESLLPVPSQFELPRDYRNRFLHVDDLNEWKTYRDWLRLWAHLALVLLILFTVASYFGDKIEALQKKWARQKSQQSLSSSVMSAEGEESPAPPDKSPPLLNV